ncbi:MULTISPECIES: hypothetical protein [Streptomyces]|uniref:hypothetical protein n=1 Tax=Streptomyces TaxID=1883 RepID=UPI002E0EA4FD|nr:hypothetical protein OG437_42710 [Streptomyces phaeochromogenes]
MFVQPVGYRTVKGSAVRAAAVAVLGSALAAGLHHATGDLPVSGPAVALAASVLFVGAFVAFAVCSPRTTAVLLAAAQGALPIWLNTTEPLAASDGHYRLPPTWHHSGPAMAALNLAMALALTWLFRSACELPARLVNACLEPARQWLLRLAGFLGLLLPVPYEAVTSRPRRRASDTPLLPVACLALRYQRVPCGP